MGWGDFGSNGSVHWRMGYDDPPDVVDHSDIDDTVKHPGKPTPPPDPRPVVGTAAGKNHPGMFRVTLRFRDKVSAKRAYDNAKPAGNTIVIDVPVHPWADVSHGPANAREVRVDW